MEQLFVFGKCLAEEYKAVVNARINTERTTCSKYKQRQSRKIRDGITTILDLVNSEGAAL